jgi:hypothetical protein
LPITQGVNPANRINENIGYLLTSNYNLFFGYERTAFDYSITSKSQAFNYALIWISFSIFFGFVTVIIYYKKDFK